MAQVSLPLAEMTVPEKLKVIERVWASLRDQDERLDSPAWHRDVLASRKRLHAERPRYTRSTSHHPATISEI